MNNRHPKLLHSLQKFLPSASVHVEPSTPAVPQPGGEQSPSTPPSANEEPSTQQMSKLLRSQREAIKSFTEHDSNTIIIRLIAILELPFTSMNYSKQMIFSSSQWLLAQSQLTNCVL